MLSVNPPQRLYRMSYFPPELPFQEEVETLAVVRKLVTAHRRLAELKGMVETIPNESILLNTLSLQEAKDSSEIENIITTHDEVYKADVFAEAVTGTAAKEVHQYASALRIGYASIRKTQLLTNNAIIQIQAELEQNEAGFRKLPGTKLLNDQTGEIVYTPPQDEVDVSDLMKNLEAFINDDEISKLDPLVKMAIIHHQFESIHPFYDGNGRTGRIINILYMVAKELLRIPVLYLSRYFIQNKDEYYRLLQHVRDTGEWEPWVLFMLDSVEVTSLQTIEIVQAIREQMMDFKHRIRDQLPKIYSQDLLNILFRHPYTKIEFVMNDLSVSRITATKYLDQLSEADFLHKEKIGRYNFYVNVPLFNLFLNLPALPST